MLNALFSKFFINGLNKQNNHVHNNYISWIVDGHWACKIHDARIIVLHINISYNILHVIAILNTYTVRHLYLFWNVS